jgi:hypothetical protein
MLHDWASGVGVCVVARLEERLQPVVAFDKDTPENKPNCFVMIAGVFTSPFG